jgi:hypothetical protein
MAMNGDTLGAALLKALDDAVAATPTAGDAQRQAIWKGIGNAIVEHITTFAQVDSIVTVTSVSLVMAGTAASGPGTGTAIAAPGSVS